MRHGAWLATWKDSAKSQHAVSIRFLQSAQIILPGQNTGIQGIAAIAVAMPYINGVAGQAGAARAGIEQLQPYAQGNARRHRRAAVEAAADVAAHNAWLIQDIDDAAAIGIRAVGRIRSRHFFPYHGTSACLGLRDVCRLQRGRRRGGVAGAAAADQGQSRGAYQQPAQQPAPFGLPFVHHFELGCQVDSRCIHTYSIKWGKPASAGLRLAHRNSKRLVASLNVTLTGLRSMVQAVVLTRLPAAGRLVAPLAPPRLPDKDCRKLPSLALLPSLLPPSEVSRLEKLDCKSLTLLSLPSVLLELSVLDDNFCIRLCKSDSIWPGPPLPPPWWPPSPATLPWPSAWPPPPCACRLPISWCKKAPSAWPASLPLAVLVALVPPSVLLAVSLLVSGTLTPIDDRALEMASRKPLSSGLCGGVPAVALVEAVAALPSRRLKAFNWRLLLDDKALMLMFYSPFYSV